MNKTIKMLKQNGVQTKQTQRTLSMVIVGTIAQEVVAALFLFLLLPKVDVNLPLWLKIVILVAIIVWSVVTYKPYRKALERPSCDPQQAIIGKRGIAMSRLNPEGLVRIEGETWKAAILDDVVEVGSSITVKEANGLKLVVTDNKEIA